MLEERGIYPQRIAARTKVEQDDGPRSPGDLPDENKEEPDSIPIRNNTAPSIEVEAEKEPPKEAVLIPSRPGDLKIRVEDRVTYIDLDSPDSREHTFHIVREESNSLMGTMNVKTHIAQALLGKRKGEVVTAKLPKGETRLKIIDIERPGGNVATGNNIEPPDEGPETNIELIPRGLRADGVYLPEGLRLRKFLHDQMHEAEIVDEGICYNGKLFTSVSAAGSEAAGYPVNGWTFWTYFEEKHQRWGTLDEWRNKRR